MSRSRPGRTKQSATRIAHHARRRLGILLGALAAASILIVLTAGGTSLAAQTKQKKYKATRAFVVDQQTGEPGCRRRQEVDEVVANLSALGSGPTNAAAVSRRAAQSVRPRGGFNGVVLARPNGDGTFETRCVFTVEEGAEFLGLVEDTSSVRDATMNTHLLRPMRHLRSPSRPSPSPPASSAPVRHNSSSSTSTRQVSASTIPRRLRRRR